METTDFAQSAQSAMSQSKSFVNRQVEERASMLGRQIGSAADGLRNVGGQLRDNPTLGFAAGYVDQAAQIVDNGARYLQQADLDRLLGDLETVARRQPWAIAACAAAFGFASSRFLKTSSARRYQASQSYGSEAQRYAI